MIATTSLPQLPGKTCTGCGGCTNACPKDAIFFAPDAEGFQHPVVQAAQCIGCLADRMKKIGCEIVTDRGDYKADI